MTFCRFEEISRFTVLYRRDHSSHPFSISSMKLVIARQRSHKNDDFDMIETIFPSYTCRRVDYVILGVIDLDRLCINTESSAINPKKHGIR